MAPRSRGAAFVADIISFSTPRSHVCRSCRQSLSQRRYASTATAEAPAVAQFSPDGPEAVPVPQPSFTIKAGIVLSRAPLITPDPHPFETSFYLYQRRLNERLVLPFSQYFYYKRGSQAFEQWRKRRTERGGVAARDIGKYNAYDENAWNDEVLIGDQTGSPRNIVEQLIDEEGRAEEFTGDGDPKLAGLRRATEADEKNDQKSLERALQRTLYLLVKSKPAAGLKQAENELWKFPSGTLEAKEGLREAAQRILFGTLGVNMNTWFVGNHPVGHYVRQLLPASDSKAGSSKTSPAKQETAVVAGQDADGEKTFFMKARIFGGQADLRIAEQKEWEDFKWVSKEEIEGLVHPDYWVRVKNMLVAQ